MQARNIEIGDVIFTADFPAFGVKDFYYAADDIIMIAFENNTGFSCHPDRELLVARNGQVL